jgi:hypothetical protein
MSLVPKLHLGTFPFHPRNSISRILPPLRHPERRQACPVEVEGPLIVPRSQVALGNVSFPPRNSISRILPLLRHPERSATQPRGAQSKDLLRFFMSLVPKLHLGTFPFHPRNSISRILPPPRHPERRQACPIKVEGPLIVPRSQVALGNVSFPPAKFHFAHSSSPPSS